MENHKLRKFNYLKLLGIIIFISLFITPIFFYSNDNRISFFDTIEIPSQITTLFGPAIQLTTSLLLFGLIYFFLETNFQAQKTEKYFHSDNKLEIQLRLFTAYFGRFITNLFPLSTIAVYYIMTPYFPNKVFEEEIIKLPAPIQFFLAIFIIDFTLYIRHRIVHHYFWPYHAIHHSAKVVTWLTTLRLHPGDRIIRPQLRLVLCIL
jgi:sterol desaturase/sphingolipid hydroxylase (fatty acid hydroxylase superfamily)